MHRLLSARNLYQSGLHGVSLHGNKLQNSSTTQIKCSFCRKILIGRQHSENLLTTRFQSTKTVSALRSMRKKAKHKYKQYGELLEVGEKAMTETKVSISKLRAVHLSKLASSPVSLGQLHQLTSKTIRKTIPVEVDPELLQTVREKLLKKNKEIKEQSPLMNNLQFESDKCALVYTSHQLSNIEDRLKAKQVIDNIKESYYNFQKVTMYDQRLQDLRFAINDGLTQEFETEASENIELEEDGVKPLAKSPHAVFRELFIDNQMDSYDQELMSHINNMQSQGVSHPAIEDIYEDGALHEIPESRDDLEFDHEPVDPDVIKGLNIKKAKQAIKKKKKEIREKRRAIRELNMKHDIKELERRGKQESLQKLLIAHLQLLCSLNMISEGSRIVQYYRQKSTKATDHPKITDVKIYNTLIHGYAGLGLQDKAKEILSLMAEDGVEPNAQTFAAIFESIERSSSVNDKLKLLLYYHQIMKEKNITLNDLLDKSKFFNDQREVVLKAIRQIEPTFTPQYTPPVLTYNCSLLNHLNEEQNVQGLKLSPAEGLLTVEDIKAMSKKQLEVENKGEIEVRNIDVRDEQSESVKFCREKLKETENEWREVIRAAFIRNLGTLKSQSLASHSAITLYPYLKVLEVDQFVDLIMGELSKLVDGSETYSPTLKLLQKDLGTQVYEKYQIAQYRRTGVLDKMSSIYASYCEWYIHRDAAINPRQKWQTLLYENMEGPSLDTEEAPWPVEMRVNVGKFLYNIIINDVKIDVNMFKTKAKVKHLPAVYKVHRPWARLVRLELKPHPVLARLWSSAATPSLRVRSSLAPAHAPPPPRCGHTAPPPAPPLIRMPLNVVGQLKRLQESPPEQLYPVLDSLNQLGEVPWTINKPILDLQLKIFRSGGNKKLDIPPPSSSLDTSQFNTGTEKPGADKNSVDKAGAFKRRLAINRARAEMHSLWCDMLYKLSLANHFRESIFWLPHNMDFRGRVYACPPHVSILGADSQRALLTFAKKLPLGDKGLNWLKIHAVNLTGTMKRATIDERLAYANSILDKILDSADRPLDGEMWWAQSEEPWQTLACCMEIANAVRSPNPEEYECGFPVHQDGSCNGLQHYAALGGDSAGAAAVNLAVTERPQDVYTAVASLVEEMRARDAAAGVATAQILENFVRRKVIKQTVMTTVYGVTRFGARLQIAKQLKDIEEFPKEHIWSCSQYLTTKTFESLRTMFTSTKLIQDWFTDCAKVISGVCGESVEWVTPLGLGVVQPYYRRGPHASLLRAPLDLHQRPCTMKQRNAFPPNFIHSLDSSHMMLTSLHAAAAPLAFVSVHDCFWTHPCTVDHMNQICREQFVALHSQPILEDLSAFLVKRYGYDESELKDGKSFDKKRVNNLLRKVPAKGDFDIKSVLKSVYFFS